MVGNQTNTCKKMPLPPACPGPHSSWTALASTPATHTCTRTHCPYLQFSAVQEG